MAQPRTELGRDPAFDGFLGAAVGEDRKGADVTVLSMLARLGVDPWDEASELSRMPEAPARKRLEALLARFRDVPALLHDPDRVALSLLELLPRHAVSAGFASAGAARRVVKLPFGAPVYWIVATLLLLVWIAALARGN